MGSTDRTRWPASSRQAVASQRGGRRGALSPARGRSLHRGAYAALRLCRRGCPAAGGGHSSAGERITWQCAPLAWRSTHCGVSGCSQDGASAAAAAPLLPHPRIVRRREVRRERLLPGLRKLDELVARDRCLDTGALNALRGGGAGSVERRCRHLRKSRRARARRAWGSARLPLRFQHIEVCLFVRHGAKCLREGRGKQLAGAKVHSAGGPLRGMQPRVPPRPPRACACACGHSPKGNLASQRSASARTHARCAGGGVSVSPAPRSRQICHVAESSRDADADHRDPRCRRLLHGMAQDAAALQRAITGVPARVHTAERSAGPTLPIRRRRGGPSERHRVGRSPLRVHGAGQVLPRRENRAVRAAGARREGRRRRFHMVRSPPSLARADGMALQRGRLRLPIGIARASLSVPSRSATCTRAGRCLPSCPCRSRPRPPLVTRPSSSRSFPPTAPWAATSSATSHRTACSRVIRRSCCRSSTTCARPNPNPNLNLNALIRGSAADQPRVSRAGTPFFAVASTRLIWQVCKTLGCAKLTTVVTIHRYPSWWPPLFRVTDLLVRITDD